MYGDCGDERGRRQGTKQKDSASRSGRWKNISGSSFIDSLI